MTIITYDSVSDRERISRGSLKSFLIIYFIRLYIIKTIMSLSVELFRIGWT